MQVGPSAVVECSPRVIDMAKGQVQENRNCRHDMGLAYDKQHMGRALVCLSASLAVAQSGLALGPYAPAPLDVMDLSEVSPRISICVESHDDLQWVSHI